MIRKAAKYCEGFFSMTVQPAMTTSGVMNVVRTISGTAMPSTPRWYQAFSEGIHSRRSTNCIAALAPSKSPQSGRLSTKAAMETSSASQRPATARASPSASTATPPAIGSQTSQLSRGKPVL